MFGLSGRLCSGSGFCAVIWAFVETLVKQMSQWRVIKTHKDVV